MESSHNGWCNFVINNKFIVYILIIALLVNLVGQTNIWVVVATNTQAANELKYGERVCEMQNQTWMKLIIGNYSAGDAYCKTHQTECARPSPCGWRYTGAGIEYQFLAGPIFILFYSLTSIPVGLASEMQNVNRKMVLSVFCIAWSLFSALGATAQNYWMLVVFRLLFGAFCAVCSPFGAYLVAGHCSEKFRGTAIGLFNFASYVAPSAGFGLIAAARMLGWRSVHLIAGIPGIIVGFIMMFTVPEPKHREGNLPKKPPSTITEAASSVVKTSKMEVLRRIGRNMKKPTVLLLLISCAFRMGSIFAWQFNIRNLVSEYYPDTKLEHWMSWIPAVFGGTSTVVGGILSDKLANSRGVQGRLIVLAGSMFAAVPFQFMSIYLPVPWMFVIGQVGANLFGEVWISTGTAAVMDLVSNDLTSLTICIAVLSLFGGSFPVVLTPIRQRLGWRTALVITYPCIYFLCGILFVIDYFVIGAQNMNYDVSYVHDIGMDTSNKNKDRLNPTKL